MRPAPKFAVLADVQPAGERDDAAERLDVQFGCGDPFGPLDSDDIEALLAAEKRRREKVEGSFETHPRGDGGSPDCHLPTTNAGWRAKRVCPHCGTTFHPVSPYAEECPSLRRHEQRCAEASSAARAFYATHRRWPRAGQSDAAEEEAA